jgi:hypothetical protein
MKRQTVSDLPETVHAEIGLASTSQLVAHVRAFVINNPPITGGLSPLIQILVLLEGSIKPSTPGFLRWID